MSKVARNKQITETYQFVYHFVSELLVSIVWSRVLLVYVLGWHLNVTTSTFMTKTR